MRWWPTSVTSFYSAIILIAAVHVSGALTRDQHLEYDEELARLCVVSPTLTTYLFFQSEKVRPHVDVSGSPGVPGIYCRATSIIGLTLGTSLYPVCVVNFHLYSSLVFAPVWVPAACRTTRQTRDSLSRSNILLMAFEVRHKIGCSHSSSSSTHLPAVSFYCDTRTSVAVRYCVQQAAPK